MSTNDNFWTPKSIFKGTNADGSKYTLREWDANSIGNLDGNGITSILASALFLVIASPISLLIAVFTYNGRLGMANLIGLVASIYFLIDVNHGWIFCDMIHVFMSQSQVAFMVSLNIASLMAHVSLFVLTLAFGTHFNVAPRMWVLLGAIVAMFVIGFKLGGSTTQKHGTYSSVDLDVNDLDSQEAKEKAYYEYMKTHTEDETVAYARKLGVFGYYEEEK